MRKIAIYLSTFFALFVPIVALAQVDAVNLIPACSGSLANQNSTVCSDYGSVNKKTPNPVIKIIKVAMEVISFFTGAAATVLIIISGMRFMTSSGDPAKVGTARSTLTYAVIGLAITALAQIIIAFVLDNVQ